MRNYTEYWEYIEAVPIILLVVGSADLWRRTQSIGPGIMVVGFAMVLPEKVARFVERWQFESLIRGDSGGTFFLMHHHWVLNIVSNVGLCIAAVGIFVWARRVPEFYEHGRVRKST